MGIYKLYHLEMTAVASTADAPAKPSDALVALLGSVDADRIGSLIAAGAYRHAADAEFSTDAGALERIWTATQNLERPWSEAPVEGVRPTGRSARSTSMGDVVVTPDGRMHACARIGWSDLGPAPDALAPSLGS